MSEFVAQLCQALGVDGLVTSRRSIPGDAVVRMRRVVLFAFGSLVGERTVRRRMSARARQGKSKVPVTKIEW